MKRDQNLVQRNLNTCQQNKFQVKTQVEFYEFYINDELKFEIHRESINVIYIAYLNKNQSELEIVERFSFQGLSNDVQEMINFIESIPKDRWIFVGLAQYGLEVIDYYKIDALESIGFSLENTSYFQGALAFIGHKNYRELASLIVSKHVKQGSLADTGIVCMELTQCSSNNKTILDYCQCDKGKYQIDQLDQNEDCNGICDLKCEVCKSNSTNCLSCSSELRDINTNCDCKATQYYDPDTCLPISDEYYQDPLKNYEIFSCEYPCYRCETKIKCFSCQNPINQQDQNICINCSNRYLSNTFECKYCQVQCQECVDDINVGCIECSHQTRNILNNCECKMGFYEQIPPNEECLKCKPECLSCNINNECTECKASLNYNNQTCLPISNNYYQDPLQNYEIFNCIYPCNQCTSKTDCLSCQSPQNRSDNITCGCNNRYYENGSYCKSCSHKCLECKQNINDICQDCSDSTRDAQNNCNCKEGFFEQEPFNTVCAKCNSFCKTCKTFEFCESCKDDQKILPLCKYKICKCGFYKKNSQCIKCTPEQIQQAKDNSIYRSCGQYFNYPLL